ncbi:ribosomal L7Ae/L30e/S12e/Gadd45 family protein [Dethiosulfovibrio sp. F2B]|uniref:ribosomal L7Ae/L30e/S12e/Gadd45 family protein n=1 Tax=Dethiosulfovibrio faecalis TaxID=2720018 RepID=UPI001F1FD3E0|nr:ribosomal L7Ae/L30e/S12e/Gadd45 family protein [Dethiosulfovibrio faecalis]MCF4152239.1 ribosomal L7Ae/L30e/S12e/Gadd45 family protein [Dethiosulfovibrio faecalis]
MNVAELAEGRRLVGFKQVRRELSRDNVRKVFIAADADVSMIQEISRMCSERGVPMETVESMASLGRACVIDRGAATAALQRTTAVKKAYKNIWKEVT